MSNHDYVVPPRPDEGYPDSFFASWGTDPVHFGKWLTAYEAVNPGDEHGDLTRWLARAVESATYIDNVAMRTITVRLPEPMISRAEAEGQQRHVGRSGVIRESLAEHWSNMDNAK